jgi:hypothetical protein
MMTWLGLTPCPKTGFTKSISNIAKKHFFMEHLPNIELLRVDSLKEDGLKGYDYVSKSYKPQIVEAYIIAVKIQIFILKSNFDVNCYQYLI